MAGKTDYALDLLSPVRHVATELGRVAPAALSLGDLAGTYRHPNPGDLARVKSHQSCETDHDAVLWLINQAITELKDQVKSNGGGIALAKPFDELRYRRSKLVRLVATDDSDEKRSLKAAYNDLREGRSFHVTVEGDRGGKKDRRLSIHPAARAVPLVSEKEFIETAYDVKAHGVVQPIELFDGQILDGQHRVAMASALKVPVRAKDFEGTEEAARERVISLNLFRRHLTTAQRGLLARELILPAAKKEAEERHREASSRGGKGSASLPEPSAGKKSTEIAAERTAGTVSARTIETMAPVDNAPATKARIRSGEIPSATKARAEAIKETRKDEPQKTPVLRPQSAYRALGTALRNVTNAATDVQEGRRGDVSDEQIQIRISEIRVALDRVEDLLS